MSEENLKIVRGAVEALQAGDDERVLAHFHEEIEIHEPRGCPERAFGEGTAATARAA